MIREMSLVVKAANAQTVDNFKTNIVMNHYPPMKRQWKYSPKSEDHRCKYLQPCHNSKCLATLWVECKKLKISVCLSMISIASTRDLLVYQYPGLDRFQHSRKFLPVHNLSRFHKWLWHQQVQARSTASAIKTKKSNTSANSATLSFVQSACFQTTTVMNLLS